MVAFALHSHSHSVLCLQGSAALVPLTNRSCENKMPPFSRFLCCMFTQKCEHFFISIHHKKTPSNEGVHFVLECGASSSKNKIFIQLRFSNLSVFRRGLNHTKKIVEMFQGCFSFQRDPSSDP